MLGLTRPAALRLPISTSGSLCLSALLAVVVLGHCGCGSERDRVNSHLQRAETLLEDGQSRAAILELRNAAQLAPDDPEIHRRVAEVSWRYGYLGDAIDFYREAVALAPDDSDTTLKLARLLLRQEPGASRKLVAEVLQREPANGAAYLVKSEIALRTRDIRGAVRHIEKARSLDPDNPEVYWGLARINEARIKKLRSPSSIGTYADRIFQAALDAYDEYEERGGDRRVLALLARARILGRWPGHEDKAIQAHQQAMESALNTDSRRDRVQVLETVRDFARTSHLKPLEEQALEQLVAVAPENLLSWQELARVRGDGEQQLEWQRGIYQRLLSKQPDSPGAHVLYAGHLAGWQGPSAAVEYLRARMEAGLDPAVLLAGIASLQLEHERPADAAKTVRELREKYPGHTAGLVATARQYLNAGEHENAAQILRQLADKSESADVHRLLASAEHQLGNHEAALAAVSRSLTLGGPASDKARRLKARILFAKGDHKRVISALKALKKRQPLSESESVMLAASYYESGLPPLGYKLLTGMLDGEEAGTAAALEFARREKLNAFHREKARRYLEKAHAGAPRNIEVLQNLTALDLEDDRISEAMARLDQAAQRAAASPAIRLLRGRVAAMSGQLQKARSDAAYVRRIAPGAANEVIELLALVQSQTDDPEAEVQRMETADREGRLPRNRKVLLARLYFELGEEEKALATYERALQEGSELRLLKNDLAFLIAKRGGDLARALELAKQATEAPGASLAAADTLGYVYLQMGEHETALWQFRYVTDHAEPPVAEHYFHMALALLNLERDGEARVAFEKALSIDPNFSGAGEARQRLDLLSQRSDPGPDPS